MQPCYLVPLVQTFVVTVTLTDLCALTIDVLLLGCAYRISRVAAGHPATEVPRLRFPTESVGRSGLVGSRLLSHPYSHRKRPVARQRRGERPPLEPGGQYHVRQVQVLPSAARRAASLVALPRVGPQAGYAIHRGGGRFRWCWALTVGFVWGPPVMAHPHRFRGRAIALFWTASTAGTCVSR